jgi:hypothetical protein
MAQAGAPMRNRGSNAARIEQLQQRKGVASPGASLPYAQQIQSSFGPEFNIGGINAQVGGQAGKEADAMNASGFAAGNRVGFSGAPDLHTAAHEAAHVFQQRQGIQLTGNAASAGPYERHADRVADAVVRGEDASPVLSEMGSAKGSGVGLQLKENTEGGAKKPITGMTEGDLLKKLDGYVEAPEGVDNAFDVFAGFLNNDQQVPEKIKFGPSHPMTRTVQGDGGVAEARAKYKSEGRSQYMYKFSLLEFLRETLEMSLTSHFLGSYTIWMAPTGDGKVMFLVHNATTRQSAARNPLPPDMRPDEGILADENLMDWESGTRDEVDWGGTVKQMFYWYEDEKTLMATPTESSMFGDVTPSAEGEAWDSRDNLETGISGAGALSGALAGGYYGGMLGAATIGPAVAAATPFLGAAAGAVGGGMLGNSLGSSIGGGLGSIFGETGQEWGSAIGGGLGSLAGGIMGGIGGFALGSMIAPFAGTLVGGLIGGGIGAGLGGGLGLLAGTGIGSLFGDDETKDSLPQSIWSSGTKVASALWNLF